MAARHELARMVSDFGRSNVFVELWDHGLPMDSVRNDAMAELAAQVGVDIIATGNVHHHSVARKRLASAMAAVRARRSLDEIDGWLPPAGMHLRSGRNRHSGSGATRVWYSGHTSSGWTVRSTSPGRSEPAAIPVSRRPR